MHASSWCSGTARGFLFAAFCRLVAAFCRLLPLFPALRLLDLRTSILLKSVALCGFCSLCVKGGFSLLFLFAALCFPVCASPGSVPSIPLRSPSVALAVGSTLLRSCVLRIVRVPARDVCFFFFFFHSVRLASRERKKTELRCLCFIRVCSDSSCARARTICHAFAPAQIPKNIVGGLFPQNDLKPLAHLASFKPPFRRSCLFDL